MSRKNSFAVSLFCWAEILAGAIGSVVVAWILFWILHGIYFVPNFGDSNIAAAVLEYLAVILFPCPFLLVVAIGLLRRKRWAWKANIGLFPFFGILYYFLFF